MVLITFRGTYPFNGVIKYTCTNNPIRGRCKVRLLDVNMFFTSTPAPANVGYYRIDSPDGQLRNDKCSGINYGGIIITPFLAGIPYDRDLNCVDNAFEFETELSTTTIVLNLIPASKPPNSVDNITQHDSGWMVFDVIPLQN